MSLVNSQAPAFTAEATTGTLSLSGFAGKRVVLYFYPKDNTSGCTLEGIDFNARYDAFKALNCEVIGISRDSIKSHQNFCTKQGFKFPLISDPDEALCQAYDVMKLKKMYGREYMGVERSTFLIDESGKVRAEWRKVKVAGHAQAVLEAVQALA